MAPRRYKRGGLLRLEYDLPFNPLPNYPNTWIFNPDTGDLFAFGSGMFSSLLHIKSWANYCSDLRDHRRMRDADEAD